MAETSLPPQSHKRWHRREERKAHGQNVHEASERSVSETATVSAIPSPANVTESAQLPWLRRTVVVLYEDYSRAALSRAVAE